MLSSSKFHHVKFDNIYIDSDLIDHADYEGDIHFYPP